MTPEQSQSGRVPPQPRPDRDTNQQTTSDSALTRLLTARSSIARLRCYATLLDLVTVRTVAVYDGHCQRVTPLGTFFRTCLRDSNCRGHHTPDNCRWATAQDQAYDRYPLIQNSLRKEETT